MATNLRAACAHDYIEKRGSERKGKKMNLKKRNLLMETAATRENQQEHKKQYLTKYGFAKTGKGMGVPERCLSLELIAKGEGRQQQDEEESTRARYTVSDGTRIKNEPDERDAPIQGEQGFKLASDVSFRHSPDSREGLYNTQRAITLKFPKRICDRVLTRHQSTKSLCSVKKTKEKRHVDRVL
ncbi:hypothetical protein DL98DRAFT_625712 [Cadophora sp. DSE1049]|nr:hypothetical protein DL98DRAFT_625712 [Cadophora sp. DSE1049]